MIVDDKMLTDCV